MAEFVISKELDNDALTVMLKGHFDKLSATKFEYEMDGALDGVTHLIIDASKLEYISSAGLRVLLTLHLAMENQGDMKILNINEVIEDIFRVTGFCDILTIEKS